MFSTPPAMNVSPSPALIAWAALAAAWSPEQQRHAGYVAVVFSRLIGAAEDHVVDGAGVDAGALDDGFDGNRRQVIRAHARERPAVLADGRSQRRADVGFRHRPTHTVFVSV